MKVAAPKLNDGLEWACLALAMWFAGAFIFVALCSLNYPFHLEWMEGQNVDVIGRVADGLPFYVAPSVKYVPFIYTPYYYYVAAFVSLFTGVDFFAGRLVSLLATLGTAALLYAWIRREGGSWKPAAIGAGLFLATYVLSGRWFDVARVDSLFLFLTLAGLYVFYFYRGWQNALGAAVLLAAAFFTKQTALMIAAPALMAGLWLDRRHALLTGGLLLAMLGGGILFYDAASDGWFSFYVFTVPAGHAIQQRNILGFWRHDMRQALGLALAAGLAVWLMRGEWRKAGWYAVLAVTSVAAAYASRLHWGGFLNVLMPMHACLVLVAGLGLAANRKYVLLSAVLLVQLLCMLYDPRPLFPGENAVATGNRFLARLKAIDGDVFMPEFQFVQTRAGKTSYDFGMAGFDVLRSNLGAKNEIRDKLKADLEQFVKEQHFAAVFPGRLITLPHLANNSYRFAETIPYPREFIILDYYILPPFSFIRTDMYVPVP